MGIFDFIDHSEKCDQCQGTGMETITGFIGVHTKHKCRNCNGSGKKS